MPNDPTRPRVSLDGFGAFVDAALEHPLGKFVAELAPDAVGQLREARGQLPDIAAGIQQRALEGVAGEIVGATRDVHRVQRAAAKAIGSFVDDMLTAAGKRTPPARRLKPPRKAKKR
jgi:hypothetical protein